MSLTPEQVKQVAHLARLELKPEKVGAYAQQLSSILDMVGQLSAAKTDHVKEMAHPLDMSQRLREDRITEFNNRDAFQEHAPAVRDGLYLVPKVIE